MGDFFWEGCGTHPPNSCKPSQDQQEELVKENDSGSVIETDKLPVTIFKDSHLI